MATRHRRTVQVFLLHFSICMQRLANGTTCNTGKSCQVEFFCRLTVVWCHWLDVLQAILFFDRQRRVHQRECGHQIHCFDGQVHPLGDKGWPVTNTPSGGIASSKISNTRTCGCSAFLKRVGWGQMPMELKTATLSFADKRWTVNIIKMDDLSRICPPRICPPKKQSPQRRLCPIFQ
jgi:hypothetical protein